MKRITALYFFILTVATASAGSWNPYINAAITAPDPMVPAEFGGTGTLSFNVGNTGSDIMPLTTGQEMGLVITLSFGIPDNVNPLAALGGSWKSMFDWTYDASNNTYQAIQNQPIPGSETNNPALGSITIDYRVTKNSFYPSTVNGFNANVQPPAYTGGFNATDDDAASSYTFVEAFDYGDAPASYGSARHEINLSQVDGFYEKYVFLGASVDPEATNQPSATANGDDITGSDDEDGVTFPALIAGRSVIIPVVVTLVDYEDSGATGRLNAWIDWNGDGDFLDSGERVASSILVTESGTVNLTVNVPATAITTRPTFARFRFGNITTSPTTDNAYGEVEDYQINIQPPPASIGDRVWEDMNGNGVQDAGEPGMTNVTVRLLDSTNGVVATSVTDINGNYLFSNRPAATYQVEVVAPTQYLFTVRNAAAATELTDSDVDPLTGRTDPVTLAAGTTNLTMDAGLYIPAELYGYLFIDENNDEIRNSNDTAITNAVVQLIVNGIVVESIQSDTNGWYKFTDVPMGVVTVQVVQAGANLTGVPESQDEMRNRAVSTAANTAVIGYMITSGYGVLTTNPGETLNFGYDAHPLSTQISLKAYATADGKVMIEITTVSENGYDDIVILAQINGEWVEVGRIPGADLEGFGSNTYTLEANGLTPGQSYIFQVLDEAGHTFTSELMEVEPVNLKVDAVALDPQYFVMTFKTEPNAQYEVHVSSSLGTDADWSVEAVMVKIPRGWASPSIEPFDSAPGGSTTVRIFRNRHKAFFKIKKVH